MLPEVLSLRRGRVSRFLLLVACVGVVTVCAFQRPFREFPGIEYRLGDIQLPPDYQERTEWTFARLMYPLAPGGRGFFFSAGPDRLYKTREDNVYSYEVTRPTD